LLLSSYKAIYRGATPAEATDLDVTIDYQESTACNFPRKSLLLAPTAKLPSKSIHQLLNHQALTNSSLSGSAMPGFSPALLTSLRVVL
jgi:hypothetical protein